MSGVFINYRGEDSRSYGALLRLELSQRFGPESVFLDTESIPAGADFATHILGRVRLAKVVLAVVGPSWLTATDTHGRRQIDRPDDWVRQELAEAFRTGVTVLPVLTDGAEPPAEEQLPANIAALARCQYRRLRHHDATADLARIVRDLVALDPDLASDGRRRFGVPRQLPAAPTQFTGRQAELAELTAAQKAALAGPTRPTSVFTISGAGGVGKTWLALHWARHNAHRYPDGQLFVNLRGYDPSGERTPPEVVLRGFLSSLGVEPSAIPLDLDAQAGLYRSLLADKRILVVLDNAADSAQVMPLLPAGPSFVLITSRRRQLGLLIVHGGRSLHLDLLSPDQALRLLSRHLGRRRVEAEPDAVTEMLDAAAGLPLALAIMAARAAVHPDFPLEMLAEELRDQAARLDALDTGEVNLSLRATLSSSCQALTDDAAELFGRLGLAPGPDIGLYAAANLAGRSLARTTALLRELENAQLVHQEVPRRYRMHDLVRAYAAELGRDQPQEPTTEALHRTVDFYVRTAFAADRAAGPGSAPIEVGGPRAGHLPLLIPDEAAARAWFDVEHPCLLDAQLFAAASGWHQDVWRLAWTLDTYHYRRGNLSDDLAVWQVAADATEQIDDPAVQNMVHRHLGQAYVMAMRHADALRHLRRALTLAERIGDVCGQAHTHRVLWRAWTLQGDHERALDHASLALPLYETLDNPVWRAEALNQVGACQARLGEYTKARAHCRRALALFRQERHQDGEARTLANLGYIAHQAGTYPDAVTHYQQALVRYRQTGNIYEEVDALEQLGHVHAHHGSRQQAKDAWQTALALCQRQRRTTEGDRIQRLLAASR